MNETIVNILWAIGGFITGGFIAYKFKVLWYKRTAFIAASVEFEQSFASTKRWLNENISGSMFSGGFKSFKDIHIATIDKFRPYLRERKIANFDKACEKFFNKKDGQYYVGYSGDKSISSKIALENLNAVLEFSKKKNIFWFC